MMKAVLGTRYGTADETLFHRVKNRVGEFIERTTGIQTIAQMHGLVDLVREFGLVPEDKILSPAEYKAIYNEELKILVNLRLAKLDRGELAISDFTLKGAVPFLRALQKAGVRLYLASGTDEEDVKQEAERLGYADVFDGGIYGSIGEVTKDAKRIVIERIMNDVGGAYEQLIAFGDGPVEMRETMRRGAAFHQRNITDVGGMERPRPDPPQRPVPGVAPRMAFLLRPLRLHAGAGPPRNLLHLAACRLRFSPERGVAAGQVGRFVASCWLSIFYFL